jgi:hypothetical protein
MSMKRLPDGSWQLWCGCGSIFTSETVHRVTSLHADHTIGAHHLETYGVDK